jgi:hypothetical protein
MFHGHVLNHLFLIISNHLPTLDHVDDLPLHLPILIHSNFDGKNNNMVKFLNKNKEEKLMVLLL